MKPRTKEAVMYRLGILDKELAAAIEDAFAVRKMIETDDVPEPGLEFNDEADTEYPEDD